MFNEHKPVTDLALNNAECIKTSSDRESIPRARYRQFPNHSATTNLPRVRRIGRFDRVNPQPVSDGAQFLLSVRVYSSHDYAKSAGVTVKLQVSVFNLNQWQPTVDCS